MNYKIPALSSVAMSTTGCLFFDPIEGDWTLGDADELCMEYQKTYTYSDSEIQTSGLLCMQFSEMDFSVDATAENTFENTVETGTGIFELSYSYAINGGSQTAYTYTYDFSVQDDLGIEYISGDSYQITLPIQVDMDDGQERAEAVLSCTLTTRKSLDCTQKDLQVDGEAYFEDFSFSGALNFQK